MSEIDWTRVGKQGFGCMGLSHTYGAAEDRESFATLDRAIELGVTFFDTADVYGAGHNEELLAKALIGRRNKLIVATKFGNRFAPNPSGIDGSPAYVRQAIEASLKRLKIDRVDLYYLHRLDKKTPIEDTVGALARLKEEGKIGAIGLSEVSAEVLRCAHAVHPIAALQSEYSLWTREVEEEILPTARELGVRFVAYSPLGRGFLAGAQVTEENDRRRIHPRFQPDAVAANDGRRQSASWIAAELGISLAQLSLAWVLSRDVVPIPGTRHIRHLEQNIAANDIVLDPGVIAEIEKLFAPGTIYGARFPADALANVPATPVGHTPLQAS